MRRRIAWLVAATTSAVVLAFVIPLGLLVRTLAEDRALAGASQDVQQVATVLVGGTDSTALGQFVAIVDDRTPRAVGVRLPDGTRIGTAVPPDADPSVRSVLGGQPVTAPMNDGAIVLLPVLLGENGTAVVASAVPAEALHAGVTRAWLTLGGLGAGMLAIAVVVADRLGRWVATPVSEVATAARRLREGDLSARVTPGGPPEVEALGRSLNRLAERIVELLALEREQAADLSHRLRTPVTALRLDVDQIDDPAVAQRLRGHVDTLVRTVDHVVAEARRPVRADIEGRCDAARVVRERAEFWSALAQDQDRALEVTLAAGPIWVAIHETDLADALDALLDNVFAHTPDATDIWIELARLPDGTVRLTVADAGPGLPSDGVTERGRSGAGSTGLGLDIARRVARASGGDLEVGRSPAGGASIMVMLGPAAV
jgi:signal transduction histidine kinase